MPEDLKKHYVDRIKELNKLRDPESAHGTADDILCEILIEFGFEEVVEEFNKLEKYYA